MCPTIIATYPSSGFAQSSAPNVFLDECNYHDPPLNFNHWSTPDGTTNAYFIVDAGAKVRVTNIRLRNAANGPYNDRGTRDYQIYASEDDPENLSTLIAEGTLAHVEGLSCDATPNIDIPLNVVARYLKFVAVNYHEKSAVLKFFGITYEFPA